MEKKSLVTDKNKNLIGIHIETEKGNSFTIPVADVRVNRERADKILKAENKHKGSKYMRPSFSENGKTYQ